jgi:hypothetical protein
MAKRPKVHRAIKRGRICDWPEGVGTPDEVAARVTYTGNPITKTSFAGRTGRAAG